MTNHSSTNSTQNQTSFSRASASARFLAIAAIAGVSAFVGVLVLGNKLSGSHSDRGPLAPAATRATADETTWDVAGDDGIALFAADWERSLTGRYALTGVIQRTPLSEEESTFGRTETEQPTAAPANLSKEFVGAEQLLALPVRRAQLDQHHSLHQIGGMATVVDPINGQRICRLRDGTYWCSGDDAAGDTEAVLSRGPTGIGPATTQAVNGEAATHRLYQLIDFATSDLATIEGGSQLQMLSSQLRCWDVRSLTGDQGHQWGRRSQFCFDTDTGAMVLNRTFGQYRTETFVAQQLSADVTLGDLDPR